MTFYCVFVFMALQHVWASRDKGGKKQDNLGVSVSDNGDMSFSGQPTHGTRTDATVLMQSDEGAVSNSTVFHNSPSAGPECDAADATSMACRLDPSSCDESSKQALCRDLCDRFKGVMEFQYSEGKYESACDHNLNECDTVSDGVATACDSSPDSCSLCYTSKCNKFPPEPLPEAGNQLGREVGICGKHAQVRQLESSSSTGTTTFSITPCTAQRRDATTNNYVFCGKRDIPITAKALKLEAKLVDCECQTSTKA